MRKHRPSLGQRRRTERRLKKAKAMGRKVLPADLQRARDIYPEDSKKMRQWRAQDKDFHLPPYAWPGGYPMFYLTRRDGVACTDCANQTGIGDGGIVDGDVNWEDPDLYCDFCSQRIESVYADDDADGAESEDDE